MKRKDDRNEVDWPQKAIMALSVVVVLALVGYLAFQAATAPDSRAPPEAQILGTRTMPDGSILVDVRLTNPSGAGLRHATVELDCDQPPPSITLDNVPAESYRDATLMCPPGQPPSKASVSTWFRA